MREKLWTKRFSLALGVSFFISMVFYLLMTTMALYAVHEFSAGQVASGLASSVFVIGAVAPGWWPAPRSPASGSAG